MIKIYGSPMSSAGRCYWMLEELGLSYEQMPLNMREKQHKADDFLKINPNGKVPAIVDGDFVVWESMAITSYLAKKYNSPLAPKTVEEDAATMQWSLWALVDLQKPAVDWLVQVMFVPAEHKSQKVIDEASKGFARYLHTLELALKGKSYLAADRFTVADLNVVSVVDLAKTLGFDFSAYPEVKRWMANCMDRPAFHKVAQLRSHKG